MKKTVSNTYWSITLIVEGELEITTCLRSCNRVKSLGNKLCDPKYSSFNICNFFNPQIKLGKLVTEFPCKFKYLKCAKSFSGDNREELVRSARRQWIDGNRRTCPRLKPKSRKVRKDSTFLKATILMDSLEFNKCKWWTLLDKWVNHNAHEPHILHP